MVSTLSTHNIVITGTDTIFYMLARSAIDIENLHHEMISVFALYIA